MLNEQKGELNSLKMLNFDSRCDVRSSGYSRGDDQEPRYWINPGDSHRTS